MRAVLGVLRPGLGNTRGLGFRMRSPARLRLPNQFIDVNVVHFPVSLLELLGERGDEVRASEFLGTATVLEP